MPAHVPYVVSRTHAKSSGGGGGGTSPGLSLSNARSMTANARTGAQGAQTIGVRRVHSAVQLFSGARACIERALGYTSLRRLTRTNDGPSMYDYRLYAHLSIRT